MSRSTDLQDPPSLERAAPQPERAATAVGVEDQARFESRHLVVLLGFTLLAALLRMHRLAEWSFWVDEAHTYRDLVMPLDLFWEAKQRAYPLLYLMLRCLPESLQVHEWGLRLPAVFFGIASVPALAVAARGMVGRRAALMAAAFLAISPWHIYHSQNARAYAMVLFFGVIALGAFWHGFERRSWPLLLIGLVAMLIAGFFHTTAFMLLGALVAYALLVGPNSERPRDTWLAKWYPLIILGVLVALTPLLFGALQHYMDVKRPQFTLMHLAQTTAYFVGLPMIVAAAGGALWLYDRGDRLAVFLSSCVVLPLFVLALLGSGIATVTARYAFYTLPAFFILASVLMIQLLDHFRGPGFRTALLRLMPVGVLMVTMLGQDFLYYQKGHGWRPRWREATVFVEEHRQKVGNRPARILTTNGPSIRYYLDRGEFRPGSQGSPLYTIEAIERWDLSTGEQAQAYLKREMALASFHDQELYVLITSPEFQEMDSGSVGETFVRNNFNQVKWFRNWNGPKDMIILVYHWRRERR